MITLLLVLVAYTSTLPIIITLFHLRTSIHSTEVSTENVSWCEHCCWWKLLLTWTQLSEEWVNCRSGIYMSPPLDTSQDGWLIVVWPIDSLANFTGFPAMCRCCGRAFSMHLQQLANWQQTASETLLQSMETTHQFQYKRDYRGTFCTFFYQTLIEFVFHTLASCNKKLQAKFSFAMFQIAQLSPLAVSATFHTAAKNPPKNNAAGEKSAKFLQTAIRQYDFSEFTAIRGYTATVNRYWVL